jgi:PAS domain S-box-containing protein
MTMEKALNILHLESNGEDAKRIRLAIQGSGIDCEVIVVSNHNDFTAALKNGSIDLILSEFAGPGWEGLSALSLSNRLCPHIPFVFVCSGVGEAQAVRAMKAGAADLVLKKELPTLTQSLQASLEEASLRKDRKHREAQIQEAASLLDKVQEAICVQDLEDNITYWNRGAEQLFGWSAELAAGKNISILHKGASAQLIQARKTVIEKGEWTGELSKVTKAGRPIVVESRWTLLRTSDGRPKSILIVEIDITERKTLEAQYLRAQRMESIGTLAGGIAHDLNNVLSPILLSVEYLKVQMPNPQIQEVLDTIETSAKNGAEMVKQILSFAKGVEGERLEIQLKHLIQELERIARGTFPKSIHIHTNIPENLWTIFGDVTQLNQAFLNILVNARDAMSKGGELSIVAENVVLDDNFAGMHSDARPGPFAVISVSDAGPGIPSEMIDKIFTPAFASKKGNTGLGLPTVQAILKNHGGFVKVQSVEGKGTTFRLYLPALEDARERRAKEDRRELPAGNGELILVVDDEASIRDITKQTLRMFGYDVLTANDGTEAVAIYAQHHQEIKVVLTDMMMPFMDGPTTIRALKRIDPRVKIIAASGLTIPQSVMEASADVQGYLPKPYTAEKLLKTLHEILHES